MNTFEYVVPGVLSGRIGRRCWQVLATLVTFAVHHPVAKAETVTVYFSGTVTSAAGNPFNLNLVFGDAVQGSISYDPSNKSLLQPAPSGMSISLGGHQFTSLSTSFQVLNDQNGADVFSGAITSIARDDQAQESSKSMLFMLADSTQSALSVSAYPWCLNLRSYGNRSGQLTDGSPEGGAINFSIDSFSGLPKTLPAQQPDTLYVADGGNLWDVSDDTVRQFQPNLPSSESYQGVAIACDQGQPSNISGPQGITMDGGQLWLVNQNAGLPFAGEIRQFSLIDSAWRFDQPVIAQDSVEPPPPRAPRGMIKDGQVFFAANIADANPADGQPVPEGSLAAYEVSDGNAALSLTKFEVDRTKFSGAFYPTGVVKGPDGLLYVSVAGDPYNIATASTGYVLRFDPYTKRLQDIYVDNVRLDNPPNEADPVKLQSPEGLVFGPDGRLFVSSGADNFTDVNGNAVTRGRILIFDGPHGVSPGKYLEKIDLISSSGNKLSARALVFGPRDRLYVPITWGEPILRQCDWFDTLCYFDPYMPNPDSGELRVYDVRTKSFERVSDQHMRWPTYLSFAATDPATLAYKSKRFELSAEKAGFGKIVSDYGEINCGGVCSYSFPDGASVKLTAIPDSRNVFHGWGGACSGSTSVCELVMQAGAHVTAEFNPVPTARLNAATTGTGGGKIISSPAGIDCGNSCAFDFDSGTSIHLVAVPDPHASFRAWSGACQGSASECDFIIQGVTDVSAEFTPRPTLNLHANGPGMIVSTSAGGIACRNSCALDFDAGTMIRLSAQSDLNAVFRAWSGACQGAAPYCDIDLKAQADVSAEFTTATVLSVNSTGLGKVLSRPPYIKCGSRCSATFLVAASKAKVLLIAQPGPGYRLAGWTGGCSGTATGCTVTMDADKQVTANFQRVYPFNVSRRGKGSVTSDPLGMIDCGKSCSSWAFAGSTVKLVATPATGYVFAGWSGDCEGMVSCSLAIDGIKRVKANFLRQ